MSHTVPSGAYRQISYYAQDIDFDKLAKRDADWAAVCKSGKETKWIDFQDPSVVLQLTRSLLKCDFGLTLNLPDDRLCPPVPVRWNYIRWLQELLDITSDNYADRYDAEREVFGLDIGVGASAIYPLLGCSTRPHWKMAGSDVDQHSMDHARRNVESNGLSKRVKLALTTNEAPLIPLDKLGIEELDFVMTNPPFYSSQADMADSYGAKKAAPTAICTGSENEMICPGGDVGFVSLILTESLQLREKVQWYTAMLGKLSSLQQIVAKLKEHNIDNYAVTCLQAGHKTKRWAIGWSFHDLRPHVDVARHGDLVHAVLPLPTAQTIAVPLMSADWAGKQVDKTLKALDLRWHWRPLISVGVMETRENVWSRAARRKKKFASQDDAVDAPSSDGLTKDDTSNGDSDNEEPVALAVKVACKEAEVELRWLRGHDHVVFQSFCGMLKRTLTGQA